MATKEDVLARLDLAMQRSRDAAVALDAAITESATNTAKLRAATNELRALLQRKDQQ